ncbi:hypothetical protein D9M72_476430 [compost metagenome]
MLDGARDTNRHVQLRRDDLAGLADLPVVGRVAGVHGSARGAERGAQLVGQRIQDLEVLGAAQAAPARDHHARAGQFRTVALGDFAAHEGGQARIGDGGNVFHRGRTALRGHGVKAGGAHGDDLHGVGRLHGGNRVARVDRTLERVGGLHADDVGDLGHVELGGHARRHVLARGGGREQDVAVAGGHGQHLGRDVFRQAVGQLRGVGQQHLGHARGGGGLVGHGARIGAGDQHVHVASDLGGGGDGVQGCALELGVIVFGNNQRRHVQTTFASFLSLSTRAATSATLMPALRAGGSLTFSVFRRGAGSTPSSSGVTVSNCFFLAFMMFGSVT